MGGFHLSDVFISSFVDHKIGRRSGVFLSGFVGHLSIMEQFVSIISTMFATQVDICSEIWNSFSHLFSSLRMPKIKEEWILKVKLYVKFLCSNLGYSINSSTDILFFQSSFLSFSLSPFLPLFLSSIPIEICIYLSSCLPFFSSFPPIFQTFYFPIFLSSYFLIFFSSYLPIFLFSDLPIFLSSYLPIFISSYLPIFLSSYLPIFLSSYLPIFLSS